MSKRGGAPGQGGCHGAGLVKCSRVAAAMGAMNRAMGGAVVEVVGLEVRVRRVHRATRRGGAGVPRRVGACREAALALAMVRGWRRAVLRAEGMARAWLLQKQGWRGGREYYRKLPNFPPNFA